MWGIDWRRGFRATDARAVLANKVVATLMMKKEMKG